MKNYIVENQHLKKELEKYKGAFGRVPYIDDGLLKGSYKVVKDIKERDSIPTCYRKYGMKVVVIGNESTGLFKEYILDSKKLKNVWKEVIVEVPITEVTEDIVDLVEDYSELAEDLETQRDLNQVLKNLVLQAQTNAALTEDVISDVTEGNIVAGQTIVEGTNLTDFVKLFLNKTFNPTFVNPSFSLNNNAGTREVGETFNLILNSSFSRGSINGAMQGNVWNPNTSQNPRSGEATNTTIDGVAGTSKTLPNYKTLFGQGFSASTTYAEGVQPKNSKGEDYSTPLPAGGLNAGTSFSGFLRRFAGQRSTVPITGSQVRESLLDSSVLNTGNSFSIVANGVDKHFVIAIPNPKFLVKVMTSNNENVTDNFSLSTIVSIPDAGGDPQPYRVYVMSTAGVFSAGLILTVTIQ